MSKRPQNATLGQKALYNSGAKQLGPDLTAVLSDTEVRKAGAERYSRRVLGLVAVTALTAMGSYAVNSKSNEQQGDIVNNRLKNIGVVAETTPQTLPTIVHEVKPGENPRSIADQYNADPVDADNMANSIQARDGVEAPNGQTYIHPGQEIKITGR
ncbi:hypothetical protein HY003_03225 [Candidatus Saccharibacteria bacterium]|nr:hypothetical protein [Candidatus Saccharibacteria bacterium]MBI3338287.1 hypothetical protein [Candidatus Saccharibacteria bacterium]